MDSDTRMLIEVTIIAGLGGVVNWIRKTHKKNWGTFGAAIITAAFTGLLSHYITGWIGMDIQLQYAISGAAGYSGGALLDTLVPLLSDIVQKRLEQHNKEV